jgi:acyl carrier protein
METLDDFVALVRDELGLPVTAELARQGLDQVPGWDSVQLLWLVTAVERTTGRKVSLPDALEASSLEGIYLLAVTA